MNLANGESVVFDKNIEAKSESLHDELIRNVQFHGLAKVHDYSDFILGIQQKHDREVDGIDGESVEFECKIYLSGNTTRIIFTSTQNDVNGRTNERMCSLIFFEVNFVQHYFFSDMTL